MRLRIRDLRKRARLTQQELADRVGISKSYVSEIEAGKKPINAKRLEGFARALGCSPLELIDDPEISGEIAEHLAILRQLSPADRAAVLRHAAGLAPREGE